MEYQKITNLLGTTPNEMPRFITKKWVEVYDQFKVQKLHLKITHHLLIAYQRSIMY